MNDLFLYGWNELCVQLKQDSFYGDFSHGRVTIVYKTCYEVISEDGVFVCELTGNMLYGKSVSEYFTKKVKEAKRQKGNL